MTSSYKEGLPEELANLAEMRVVRADSLTATIELTRDWEFSTRMGGEQHTAENLLAAIGSLLTG